MTGSLTVYVGGMMSGKSSRLIQEITRYADASSYSGEPQSKPLLINNSLDCRSIDTVISSHSSQFKGISSRIDIISTKKLNTVDVSRYDVIGIDEIQFFDDLKETIISWLKLGKHIYCSGLNGDAFQNHFGQVHTLLPICDHFEYLHAICQICMEEKRKETSVLTPIDFQGMQASFSKRLTTSTSQVEVGAADKYIAVCRRHFEC